MITPAGFLNHLTISSRVVRWVKKGNILLFFAAITLLFFTVSASPQTPQSPQFIQQKDQKSSCNNMTGISEVTVKDNLISLDLQNAELMDILKEISRKTKVPITAGEGIKGVVSIKMTDATLENVLKQLCKSRTIVYEYLPETKSYRIVEAGAYASGKAIDVVRKTDKADKAMNVKQQSPEKEAKPSPERDRLYDSKGRRLYRPGELLVKFKKGTAKSEIDDLHRSLGSRIIKSHDGIRLQRIRLKEGLSEKEAISRYNSSGLVEVAEKHVLRYPQLMPDDPYFAMQWGLHNIGQGVNSYPPGVNDADIDAPEAWETTQGNRDLVIAVIDTGVDYNHPDLKGNVWINPHEIPDNSLDDDPNPQLYSFISVTDLVDDVYGWDFAGNLENVPTDGDNNPMDVNGHGTHVAGIIAANGNNNTGISGVLWSAKIMLLKVMADDGYKMDGDSIISALYYAMYKGARIVNCSYGGEEESYLEWKAIQDLRDSGDILVVCAAGNDGKNSDTDIVKNYPSYYDLDNIISVTGNNQNDELASFSNYGPISVDVMAPGVNIYSTSLNGGYLYESGTSMSTAYVTGIAGLLLSKKPSLSYLEVKSAIINSVDKLDSVKDKLVSGGRVNAESALASVLKGDISGDGLVRLEDAILALQLVTKLQATINNRVNHVADTNGDDRIGLAEIIYILQKITELRP